MREARCVSERSRTSYFSNLTSDTCLRSLKLLVHLYRSTVGMVLPNSCRYQPTCSQYALDALGEYGPAKGTLMALKRIARCHPWAAGGYDPVPRKWRMADIQPRRTA